MPVSDCLDLCRSAGWRLADIHSHRRLCTWHGAGAAAMEMPVCAQLLGGWGSSRASPQRHAAAVPVGQGARTSSEPVCLCWALSAERKSPPLAFQPFTCLRLLCRGAGALPDHVQLEALPHPSVPAVALHAPHVHVWGMELCSWSHLDSNLHTGSYNYHLVRLSSSGAYTPRLGQFLRLQTPLLTVDRNRHLVFVGLASFPSSSAGGWRWA